MPDFVLDADPIIPTGIPATPEQVAQMIADPAIPVDAGVLPELSPEQRPSADQIAAAGDS